MKKYAFIIDIGKCENCNNCFLACKDEHCGNDWNGYTREQPLHGHRWMNIRQKERGRYPMVDIAYVPVPCMHCDDAPCVADSDGLIRKRDDGIVLINSEAAQGNRKLAGLCPHGAIWWNEEQKVVQKCTMCAHLLDSGWKMPRCVQACPTGALAFFAGTDVELQQKISEECLQTLTDGEKNTGMPRCYYRNLHRYLSVFVAGSLAKTVDGVEECAVGEKIFLQQGDMTIAEQLSDEFGDFRFDNLPAKGGEYTLKIVGAREKQLRILVEADQSMYLGVLSLGEPSGPE